MFGLNWLRHRKSGRTRDAALLAAIAPVCEAMEARRYFYVDSGNDWPQPGGSGTAVELTYSYSNLLDGNLSGGLTSSEIRSAIEEALALWASFAPLRFTEVTDSGPSPSDTDYTSGSHPDLRFGHHAIDGTGGELAHAYYPELTDGLAGDVHFDSAEDWALHPDDGFDLVYVAVHEIGHALGLAHEEDIDAGGPDTQDTAVMNPFYSGDYAGAGSAFLYADDVAGIQAIYGQGKGYALATGGKVLLGGTDAANDIDLSISGGNVSIDIDGTVFTFSTAAVDEVVVYGRDGHDDITAAGSVNIPVTMIGGKGDDTLVGGTGNDRLEGRQGDDYLSGGAGNDALWGGADEDSLIGSAGHDTLRGGNAVDRLDFDGYAGVLEMYLEADGETAEFTDRDVTNGYNYVIKSDIEWVQSGTGADKLKASQTANVSVTLKGGAGNDTITGGIANDYVSGEGGNDSVMGGAGNDSVAGSSGDDYLSGGSGTDTIGVGDDTLAGSGQDTVAADDGTADYIYMREGVVDTIDRDANDILDVDGNDVLT